MIDSRPTFFNNPNIVYLNSKEAAEYLRITPNYLRVLVCRGIVKAYKFKAINRNRFRKDELEKLIESSY